MRRKSGRIVGEGTDRIGGLDQNLAIRIDRKGWPTQQDTLFGGRTVDGRDPATTGQSVGDQDRAPSMPGGRF